MEVRFDQGIYATGVHESKGQRGERKSNVAEGRASTLFIKMVGKT